MPAPDTVKKLRRLAKKEGMPDMVCIEREQFNRLKNLAKAYVCNVIDDVNRLESKGKADEQMIELRASAKKELKQIRAFRP